MKDNPIRLSVELGEFSRRPVAIYNFFIIRGTVIISYWGYSTQDTTYWPFLLLFFIRCTRYCVTNWQASCWRQKTIHSQYIFLAQSLFLHYEYQQASLMLKYLQELKYIIMRLRWNKENLILLFPKKNREILYTDSLIYSFIHSLYHSLYSLIYKLI